MRRYLFGEKAKTRWSGRGGKRSVLWFRVRRKTGQEARIKDKVEICQGENRSNTNIPSLSSKNGTISKTEKS